MVELQRKVVTSSWVVVRLKTFFTPINELIKLIIYEKTKHFSLDFGRARRSHLQSEVWPREWELHYGLQVPWTCCSRPDCWQACPGWFEWPEHLPVARSVLEWGWSEPCHWFHHRFCGLRLCKYSLINSVQFQCFDLDFHFWVAYQTAKVLPSISFGFLKLKHVTNYL